MSRMLLRLARISRLLLVSASVALAVAGTAMAQDASQLQQQLAEALASNQQLQARLAALGKEVEVLRRQVLEAQGNRDKNLKSVVESTDQLHQAFNEIKRLKALNAQLSALVPKPPERVLSGLVTATPAGGTIEISLGSDDGLQKGHRLEVYRQNGTALVPLAHVEVVQAAKDKAVCKVDPKSLSGPIRKDDRVTSGDPTMTEPSVGRSNLDQPPHLVDGTVLSAAAAGEVKISFGARHGLKPGHCLEVYRLTGGQGIYIGRIEVVKTEAQTSICRSILELARDTVRQGDRIVSKID